MDAVLTDLLRRNSRSLYLSLQVLPAEIREAMGLGYLLCRAADSIADTRAVSPERRTRALELFRDQYLSAKRPDHSSAILAVVQEGPENADEKALLRSIEACHDLFLDMPEGERGLLTEVVDAVTRGMLFDLERFPLEKAKGDPVALPDAAATEEYCRLIGGAPGVFWTKLCYLRLHKIHEADMRRMLELGRRYGEGLQMVNILRDLAEDARLRRCYLPAGDLAAAGVAPADLLEPGNVERLRPAVLKWTRWGLERLDSGAEYLNRIPPEMARLRLAVSWPLILGYKTLQMIAQSGDLLDPKKKVKVPKFEVMKLMPSVVALSRTPRRLAKIIDDLGAKAKTEVR